MELFHFANDELKEMSRLKAFYLDFSSRPSRDTANFLFINRFAVILLRSAMRLET